MTPDLPAARLMLGLFLTVMLSAPQKTARTSPMGVAMEAERASEIRDSFASVDLAGLKR